MKWCKNDVLVLVNSQVLIGQNQKKKKVVGYFNCTHLHAPEGKSQFQIFLICSDKLETYQTQPTQTICGLCLISSGEGEIRCEQLNMVTKWIGDFQDVNRQSDEDVVFDVLCGDFNFDNCSTGVLVFYSCDYYIIIIWESIFTKPFFFNTCLFV